MTLRTCRPRIISTLLLLVACSQPPAAGTEAAAFDLAAARTQITALNNQFTQAHVRGDSTMIDSLFTADARSLPPGAEAAVGMSAIHALTVEYIKAGITEFREETVSMYGTAAYVVDEGTYVMSYGAPPVTERGKYLNVWKQVDGSWKIQTNIWNVSSPPAAK